MNVKDLDHFLYVLRLVEFSVEHNFIAHWSFNF